MTSFKVFIEGIKKVLNIMILRKQIAFMDGRKIVDSLLIANEVVDERRKLTTRGMPSWKGCIFLTMDLWMILFYFVILTESDR